jgi:hypothetical protein
MERKIRRRIALGDGPTTPAAGSSAGSGDRVPHPTHLVAVRVENGDSGGSGDVDPGQRTRAQPMRLVFINMSTLAYEIVDVFTDRPFAGNPLAVFPEAEGLTAVQMQAIASEMNLSETTFVTPPEADGDPRAHLHPAVELPFAGTQRRAAVTASRRGCSMWENHPGCGPGAADRVRNGAT